LFLKIDGIIGSILKFANGTGPSLKNSSGVIEARNSADDAYAVVRVATAVNNNDALTKAQFDDHSARHESGGNDAIKLDDLAAPDDNTDLNASTTKHGLLLKLDNNASNFLNGQGAWAVPGASSLPSQWNYAESEAESSTTSTTYQTKVTMTTGSLPSGDYMVEWSAELTSSQRDRNTFVEIADSVVGTLAESTKGKVDVDLTYTIVSGIARMTSISGVRTITLKYKSVVDYTGYIRRARLALWRVA